LDGTTHAFGDTAAAFALFGVVGTGFAAAWVAFVDGTTAGIIESIANFGFGGLSDAFECTILALVGTFAALAFFGGICAVSTATGVPFIDGAVAIVVFSVAGLGFGRCVGHTLDAAIGAGLGAVLAFAFFGGVGASSATSGVAFIDGTITIVVESIADFCGGTGIGNACEGAALALLDAFAAFAFFGGISAGFSATWVTFIDGTVTIVVFAVAGFGFGRRV
jgi:hypothetical protein